MNIRPILKGVFAFGKKHATKFLAGGAIATEILGFYFMHKEAPVVRKKLDELPKDAKVIDKIKVAAPVYLPAIAMATASSGCIIGGCALGEIRLADMTNVAMASEAALMRYNKKVADTFGQEKAEELQKSMTSDMMKEKPVESQDIIATGYGTDVFYDPLSGRYFESCEKAILSAYATILDRINGSIEKYGGVEVNEWYHELGIPSVGLAKGKEWNLDHPIKVEIGDWESMPNGRPCRPLLYYQLPVMYNGKYC